MAAAVDIHDVIAEAARQKATHETLKEATSVSQESEKIASEYAEWVAENHDVLAAQVGDDGTPLYESAVVGATVVA